jgi:hypothetical protein
MYYKRVIAAHFEQKIMVGGPLRWLVDYVKAHDDLDLLIGKNKQEEYLHVYRGLTKIVTIIPTSAADTVNLKTADAYKSISPSLAGRKTLSDITEAEIEAIRKSLAAKGTADRYYGNKKEGYYQNELSRMFGLYSRADSDFIILDKEAVVGYKDEEEKARLFGPLHGEYKELQKKISKRNPERYGRDLVKKSIGNELDFLAVDKNGDILLMELKHGTNTSGIYLSPLQIGLYLQIFNMLPWGVFQRAVTDMFDQKRKIGLINSDWKMPELSRKIIPILIVAEPNQSSSADEKFCEILDFCRQEKGPDFLQELRTMAYTTDTGLTVWGES